MGWNYFIDALIGYAIVFYITFGGFIAVAWSDFIQGSLMFLALYALPFIGLFFLNQEMTFW
ncbi:MAG: sodium:solute symporter family transporter [Cytophagales bacterium]